jgi:hypothetical protein
LVHSFLCSFLSTYPQAQALANFLLRAT